jgi:hypothetical protein
LSDSDLSSYALVDALSEDCLVFATIDGRLKFWTARRKEGLLDFQFSTAAKIHDGKIFALSVLSDDTLLTCGQAGEVIPCFSFQ